MKNLIIENHYRIQSIIKKMTGGYNEDIEQEVYIRTFKNLNKYEERNKFSSWISVITANICRDYLKSAFFKNKKNTLYDEDMVLSAKSNSQPERILTQKERQKAVLKAVNLLPSKLKKVIILYEFEDLSYEQISKKLNIPIGTVKSRISNARKLLQSSLQFLLGDD